MPAYPSQQQHAGGSSSRSRISATPSRGFFPPPFRLDRATSVLPEAVVVVARPRKALRNDPSPPLKRRKLQFTSELTDPDTERLERGRFGSTLRLKHTLEDIYARYGSAHLQEQDEIYLGTGDEAPRVIRDKGTLRSMPVPSMFGSFIKDEELVFEGSSDEKEEEEENGRGWNLLHNGRSGVREWQEDESAQEEEEEEERRREAERMDPDLVAFLEAEERRKQLCGHLDSSDEEQDEEEEVVDFNDTFWRRQRGSSKAQPSSSSPLPQLALDEEEEEDAGVSSDSSTSELGVPDSLEDASDDSEEERTQDKEIRRERLEELLYALPGEGIGETLPFDDVPGLATLLGLREPPLPLPRIEENVLALQLQRATQERQARPLSPPNSTSPPLSASQQQRLEMETHRRRQAKGKGKAVEASSETLPTPPTSAHESSSVSPPPLYYRHDASAMTSRGASKLRTSLLPSASALAPPRPDSAKASTAQRPALPAHRPGPRTNVAQPQPMTKRIQSYAKPLARKPSGGLIRLRSGSAGDSGASLALQRTIIPTTTAEGVKVVPLSEKALSDKLPSRLKQRGVGTPSKTRLVDITPRRRRRSSSTTSSSDDEDEQDEPNTTTPTSVRRTLLTSSKRASLSTAREPERSREPRSRSTSTSTSAAPCLTPSKATSHGRQRFSLTPSKRKGSAGTGAQVEACEGYAVCTKSFCMACGSASSPLHV